jgi:hypothetical protein
MLFQLIKWFDPLWATVDPQQDEKYNTYWKGIRALALYYSFQLAFYLLISEIAGLKFPSFLKDGKYLTDFKDLEWCGQIWQILGTIMGAGLGIVFLWWYRTRKNSDNSQGIRWLLRGAALLFCLGGLLTLCWYKYILPNTLQQYKSYLCLGRFLFGMGWACGIGGAIIWCCESLPTYLRTTSALFIGGLAFLMAALVLIPRRLLIDDSIEVNLLLGALLAIGLPLTSVFLPKDARITKAFKTEDTQTIESPQRRQRSSSFFMLAALLLGISVHYSAFFLQHFDAITSKDFVENIPWKDFVTLNADAESMLEQSTNIDITKAEFYIKQALKRDKTVLLVIRYFSCFVASLLLARLINTPQLLGRINLFYRKRIRVLASLQFGQLLCLLGFFLIWLKIPDIFFTQPWVIWILCSIFGMFATIWIISLLAVAEQFSLKKRIILVIAAPAAYRVVVDAIMLGRTGDVALYAGDKSLGVWLWGLVFLFVAWVLTLGMEEAFEENPLFIDKTEKLSNASVRREVLDKIGRKDNELKDLSLTNQTLVTHLINILKQHLFYGTFYYKKEANFQSLPILLNEEAYDFFRLDYEREQGDQKLTQVHQIVTDLVNRGQMASFISSIVDQSQDDKPLNGGVIWSSPRDYPLRNYEQQGYRTINLAKEIHPSPEELEEHIRTLNYDYDKAEEKDLVQQYFESIPGNNQDRLLQLLRADAERYIPGGYYIYVIKPYTTESELVLVLKTAVSLDETRLEELRSLVSFAQTNVINEKRYRSTIDNLLAEIDHNRKAEMGFLMKKIATLSYKSVVPQITPAFEKLSTELKAVSTHLYQTAALMIAIERYATTPARIYEENNLSPFTIQLDELLQNIWTSIGEGIGFLRLSKKPHADTLAKLLAEPLALPPGLSVDGIIPTLLQVVCFELIKNAAEQSAQPPDTRLSVAIKEQSEGVAILVSNSIPEVFRQTLEEELDQWSLDVLVQDEPLQYRRKGIRTIKKLLRFQNQLLAPENALKLSASLDNDMLITTLFIPHKNRKNA